MSRTTSTAARSSAPGEQPARGEPAPVRRALVAAFAGIAVAFTVGLVAAHTFVDRIRAAAAEITGNSAPTITNLSEMRSVLRQLQVAVDTHLASCGERGCGAPPPRLAELQQELRAAWQRYRLLPTFPGETALWPQVDADLDRLAQAVALAVDSAGTERGHAAAARLRAALPAAFDGLDREVARIVEADHAAGLAVAARIERLTRLSTIASVVLDLTTVVLTIVAALLALRLWRRYEEALVERADDLEQFASRVAHDVKGPLAATGLALHIASRLSPEAAAQALERGRRGVARVQRLVDDLLEFARAGAIETRRASSDVREIVEEVVVELRDVAAEHRVEVRVEDLAGARVACSPGVLGSIVGNLVRNAITHMGDSPVREVRVRAPPALDGEAVRIEVEDTGPGIPEAIAPRVFDPFVRGAGPDVPGSGLGLATVKRFVAAHGGRVGFRSEEGRGTLFWLELPRGAEPAAPDAPG